MNRFNAAVIHKRAHGRWHGILSGLGITVSTNPKQHGPCPTCGGKDRFRFDDKDGRGTWFCNQCTPQAGNGFALVMNVRGCDFPEALQIVAEALNLSPSSHVPRQAVPKPMIINRIALAFQFELAALDLRLRAERIIAVGKTLDMASLSDAELDRALSYAAQVHANVDRAEFCEGVADDLRMKEFLGRGHEPRQRVA